MPGIRSMNERTKSLAIPKAVKQAVSERDSFDGWPCCILCGKPAPNETAWSNAHYIARSQGGLGIEENIVTLCPVCHRDYDQSSRREEIRIHIKAYLQSCYADWNENNLIYEKR